MQKNQFLPFVFWTLIMMVIIGVVQIALGVFHIYNPEEEAFELASSHREISLETQTKINRIKDVLINRRSSVQNYIDSLPATRAQSFVERVNRFLEQYDTQGFIEPFSPRAISPTQVISPPARAVETSAVTQAVDTKLWKPNLIERPDDERSPSNYRNSIIDVFLIDFFQSKLWVFDVIIDHGREQPRGQMKDQSIILSYSIDTLDELAKVLVHEIGHVIDIYLLQKSSAGPDPSYEYYRISWDDVDTQKAGSSESDFISGYAATNQYEDFAESFGFYLFHSSEFAKRAQSSARLKLKYDFLKEKVFQGAFSQTSYEKESIPNYIWDTTKVELRSDATSQLFSF